MLWEQRAQTTSEAKRGDSAMAGAAEGGRAILLVLIVSFSLLERYGAEAPSLLIAITPWLTRRSPFGVTSEKTHLWSHTPCIPGELLVKKACSASTSNKLYCAHSC